MEPRAVPSWLQPRYRKNVYLFIYYLIQFCGHSWIFTNMTVRFLSFGKDSMVDTFYAIGLVMRLCQSISLLELLHIYVGIESDHLFPRFLQLTERIIILFVVITSQEEVQGKYVVCVLFIFWNLLDTVRYTYCMLAVIGISYAVLTWLSQTLWMLIYPLCVLAEGPSMLLQIARFHLFPWLNNIPLYHLPSISHCLILNHLVLTPQSCPLTYPFISHMC
ncbi:very-long-chain (3R)-3-hydroxyacyl-CoA dehydratase 4 isoform X2 [Manis pentadactyla]|uniref:very-long-chain (3R)-3-hydroxyacyl-CoA dehydratase 4 isoform X2 n=1 Tax=Manis pentadactyla TaxID=143292 RepID=UPI00255C78AB|nr:very-long-chain (3R)-3-hydroxyacyl-CoA dehydratase 4 isoform X2 [Manis pentadactyla]